ncbi:hypothetical protein [Elioraea sp.]|jgi:hypothetical protein|uniref:hypothetical protein n=1 Tax=Elioraea sp. TaxID=2185103 RepID=UPI0021DECE7A|nr:hypothetical protein [Elioraea sp.]GIX11022.1 MAG: hypothetical protein KatS3mg116_2732 [Elioraea sp.]
MAKDPTAGMTDAQRAYEAKRAAKAGMTLEKWLARKAKAKTTVARTPAPAPAPKRPGLLRRALARARGEA